MFNSEHNGGTWNARWLLRHLRTHSVGQHSAFQYGYATRPPEPHSGKAISTYIRVKAIIEIHQFTKMITCQESNPDRPPSLAQGAAAGGGVLSVKSVGRGSFRCCSHG